MGPARRALVPFGWDEEWEAQVPPTAAVGRIVRVDRGECDVITAEGVVRAVSDPARAQAELAPVTGDWVLLGTAAGSRPAVTRILPRRRALVRRDPSEAVVDQVLVANVDTVLLVHGLDRPLPPGRLERFLVQAADSGADPVVVLTKRDLVDDPGEASAVVRAVAPGVRVLVTSAVTGDGLVELRRCLVPGTTTVLVGESGAGKSTLINALLGDRRLPTAPVRPTDAKGRHTTTARDLVLIPGGGAVVDTPGLRAVGLWASEDALARVFADIAERAAECRFRDCAHGAEPDCSVRGAVDPRRLERYRALAAEIEEMRAQEARRARGRRGRPRQPH